MNCQFSAPDTPEIIVSSLSNSCKIEWRRPEMNGDFENYTIEIYFEGFTNNQSENSCSGPNDLEKSINYKSNASNPGDDEKYEYTDTLPFAQYSIRIRAANQNFIGEFSAKTNCIINPVFEEPSPPQAIQFENTSLTFSTSVEIPKNFCGTTNVSFVCGSKKSSVKSVFYAVENPLEVFKSTIEGLTPFTNYECHVVFEYEDQKTESSKASFKTLEGSM